MKKFVGPGVTHNSEVGFNSDRAVCIGGDDTNAVQIIKFNNRPRPSDLIFHINPREKIFVLDSTKKVWVFEKLFFDKKKFKKIFRKYPSPRPSTSGQVFRLSLIYEPMYTFTISCNLRLILGK